MFCSISFKRAYHFRFVRASTSHQPPCRIQMPSNANLAKEEKKATLDLAQLCSNAICIVTYREDTVKKVGIAKYKRPLWIRGGNGRIVSPFLSIPALPDLFVCSLDVGWTPREGIRSREGRGNRGRLPIAVSRFLFFSSC